jgi:hypothetical protein
MVRLFAKRRSRVLLTPDAGVKPCDGVRRQMSSVEGGNNNSSDSDARGVDVAWTGLGGVLEAGEHDRYDSEDSNPRADDTFRVHVYVSSSSASIGQQGQKI